MLQMLRGRMGVCFPCPGAGARMHGTHACQACTPAAAAPWCRLAYSALAGSCVQLATTSGQLCAVGDHCMDQRLALSLTFVQHIWDMMYCRDMVSCSMGGITGHFQFKDALRSCSACHQGSPGTLMPMLRLGGGGPCGYCSGSVLSGVHMCRFCTLQELLNRQG
jgi:hypothetical protein